jgi:hypothetical protein
VNLGVQGLPEALGPKWLTSNRLRPSGLVWSGEDTCAGDVEAPSLVEKLFSGGGIKVAKGAWQVLNCLAFVASQLVLVRETW